VKKHPGLEPMDERVTFVLTEAEKIIFTCLKKSGLKYSDYVRQAIRLKFSRDITGNAEGFVNDPVLAAHFHNLQAEN
jgi:hypothetical protein